MKRKRVTEEQIIGVLKAHELGARTWDLCRQHGISAATFYNRKSKYGGMDVSEAKQLKALETENAKLKRLVAEPCATTQPTCCQKMVTPRRAQGSRASLFGV